MKILTLLFVLFAKLLCASPTFYVLGEDYLLYSTSKESTVVINGLSPKSWALDSNRCRLWITTEGSNQLLSFEKGKKQEEISFAGRIVSEVSQGQFVTALDSGEVQLRNTEGVIVSQFPIQNAQSLRSLALLSNGDSWGMFQDEAKKNNLELRRMNSKGEEMQKLSLLPSEEFWGKVQLFVDEVHDRMWVGYARKSTHHAYAPKVDRFSLSGSDSWTYQWDERGFFFDGCVNKEGDLVVARDLPTSPYTVPDYSFVDKIGGVQKASENPERLLELETNRLVDSMACRNNSFYFATHSIFGSEPKQLLFWSGDKKEQPEVYLTLPATAKKVLLCDEAKGRF